jgi:DNA repair protein RadC
MTTATTYKLQDNNLLLDNGDRKYVLKIKDLPEKEKPREKMIECGPSALSSAELLAVVLNVGTKKEEVLEMSSRIIKEYGEKTIISQTNPSKLEKDIGIPLVKACQIIACFELGRRFFKETNEGKTIIRTPKQAYEYLKDMGDLQKECLRGIYLNSRYCIVHDEIISIGSLTANITHPREVFKPAIEHSATAVILAHNHPSNNPKPTLSDIETTNQLIDAGKILGIDLLDHLVITKDKFAGIPANYCHNR